MAKDKIAEKYNKLIEEVRIVKDIVDDLESIIGYNEQSISWHRQYMAEQIEGNPDFDCSYCNAEIAKLEKENTIIEELERSLWASRIGEPYGL